jgi:hypothetical protein
MTCLKLGPLRFFFLFTIVAEGRCIQRALSKYADTPTEAGFAIQVLDDGKAAWLFAY